jgi:hypothetical protein
MRSRFQEVGGKKETRNIFRTQVTRTCICKLISENPLLNEIIDVVLHNSFFFHILNSRPFNYKNPGKRAANIPAIF